MCTLKKINNPFIYNFVYLGSLETPGEPLDVCQVEVSNWVKLFSLDVYFNMFYW